MSKKILMISMLFLFLFTLSFSSALTASIGNSRAILYPELIDGKARIERTLRVINSNDIRVNITITPDDAIIDIIELIDKSFVLGPGEEKKARYVINLKSNEKRDGRILVKFSPLEGNDAASGLAARLIIIPDGDGFDEDGVDEDILAMNPNTRNNQDDGGDEEEDDVDVNIGGALTGNVAAQDDNSLGIVTIVLWLTALIMLIMLIIIIVKIKSNNNSGKKSGNDAKRKNIGNKIKSDSRKNAGRNSGRKRRGDKGVDKNKIKKKGR